MNQESTISENPSAPRAKDLDALHEDITLLKAEIAELEAEVSNLIFKVTDLQIELDAAPDPDLLADIRRDLEQGDVEYALIRIGRAIGW
ncbi:hypothetical protein CN151_15740 [Sinorhizobium meliloti]|uniref:hypothetical protein n=1 Tax=Rhizobium meliloti TaxID=382 RepID=UPI0002A56B47|nr:hypothetical protein [Sinorhizobium meliloti]AGA07735.1 hypothetical protein C770_GR4Chr2827 [Sinorhizobium meliloti GR4]RVL03181.1 hypothetical protein CN151_15740 [Sinorhizobium meliloti]RVM94482.1 hypothetical protein CN119_11670 [Sinorhizobium meliloti]RVN11303.1 hypothetical protein CN112_10440 [Sinorhizobium meliloti]